MSRWRSEVLVTAVLLAGCASAGRPPIDPGLLKGAWRSDHEAFDFEIRDRVILYEYDMQEHRCVLAGDTLTVDLGPDLGTARRQVLKVTRDSLVVRDLESGALGRFSRMK
jgi:hypothetical protein